MKIGSKSLFNRVVKSLIRGGLYCLLSLIIHYASFGQGIIKGQLLDASTKIPIAFAHLQWDSIHGTTSDINGIFNIQTNTEQVELSIKHLNYKDTIIHLGKSNALFNIELHSKVLILKEFTIIEKDFYAEEILKNVLEHAPFNDPYHLDYFQCKTYQIFRVYPMLENIKNSKDLAFFEQRHLLLMETFSQKKYVKKSKFHEEQILTQKISGFKNPEFAALSSDFQPFSIYSKELTFFEKTFINPIHPQALQFYEVRLLDSMYEEGQLLYHLSFSPQKGVSIETLEGELWIQPANNWGIKKWVASPSSPNGIQFKSLQILSYNNDFWFPEQLHFEWQLSQEQWGEHSLILEGKMFIESVETTPFVPRINVLRFENPPQSIKSLENDSIWNTSLHRFLTAKDSSTYAFLDSLGEVHHLDRVNTVAKYIVNDEVRGSHWGVSLSPLFLHSNQYEGFRSFFLGHIYAFSDHLHLYGGMGFGFKDNLWKKSIGLEWRWNLLKSNKVGILFKDDLEEVGQSQGGNYQSPTISRRYFQRIMSHSIDRKAYLQFQIIPSLQARFELGNKELSPLYVEAWRDSSFPSHPYIYTYKSVNIRHKSKEYFSMLYGRPIAKLSNSPEIIFNGMLVKGKDSEIEGFTSWLRIKGQYSSLRWGSLIYQTEHGYAKGSLPLHLWFGAVGMRLQLLNPYLLSGTYPSLGQYRLFSKGYSSFIIGYAFKNILWNTHQLRSNPYPSIQYHLRIPWTKEEGPTTDFQMEVQLKNFHEVGLEIHHILGGKYMQNLVWKAGVGCFTSLGAYRQKGLASSSFVLLLDFDW